MKFAPLALGLAAALAMPAAAQTAPAPATTAAPATKFNLDTPIETLLADPAAKAVLDQILPTLSTNPNLDMFKSLSLRQVQPYSQGQLTDELMAKVEAGLAAIK